MDDSALHAITALAAIAAIIVAIIGSVWKLRSWMSDELKILSAVMTSQWDKVTAELKELNRGAATAQAELTEVRTRQQNHSDEILRLRDQSRSHDANVAELRGAVSSLAGTNRRPRTKAVA